MFEGLDRATFERASETEREALCLRLATLISARLRSAPSFHDAVMAVVDELRAAGHDLWSFDEDGAEWELWCPDYSKPSGPGIVVVFSANHDSDVSWTRR